MNIILLLGIVVMAMVLTLKIKTIAWAIRHPRYAFCWYRHRKPFSSVHLLGVLLCALCASALIPTARAQDSNTVATIKGVGTTIGSWFSSENPANRFQDAQLWTGVINQNNAPVANEVGLSYDLWRQHGDYFPYTAATNQPNSSIYAAIETRVRDSQIGIMSFGFGPQIGWMQNDVRIGIFVEPVYRLDKAHSRYRAEFGISAEKMLTANTAIGLVISQQTHESVPFFGGQMHVSFGNGKGLFGLF